MNRLDPIGVIDSGVGGLTVLKWLQEKMPHERFIFIGDTARTPYGNRSREEIQGFVGEMTAWLNRRNIKQLVVACNTITVLGTDVIKNGYDFSVIGMKKGAHMVEGVTRNKSGIPGHGFHGGFRGPQKGNPGNGSGNPGVRPGLSQIRPAH